MSTNWDALSDLPECEYCGAPAETLDHVLPRTLRFKIQDTLDPKEYATLLRELPDVVPCCYSCNSLKANQVFGSIREIRRDIGGSLRRKHRHLLNTPNWTEEELSSLSYSLRSSVLQKVAQKEIVEARLRRLMR